MYSLPQMNLDPVQIMIARPGRLKNHNPAGFPHIPYGYFVKQA